MFKYIIVNFIFCFCLAAEVKTYVLDQETAIKNDFTVLPNSKVENTNFHSFSISCPKIDKKQFKFVRLELYHIKNKEVVAIIPINVSLNRNYYIGTILFDMKHFEDYLILAKYSNGKGDVNEYTSSAVVKKNEKSNK